MRGIWSSGITRLERTGVDTCDHDAGQNMRRRWGARGRRARNRCESYVQIVGLCRRTLAMGAVRHRNSPTKHI